MNLKEYLTIKPASQLIGVSPDTLRRWDKTGKLKAERHPISGYRLYKQSKIIKHFRIAEPPVDYKTYKVTYPDKPFTDFKSITPSTPIESLNLNWREADLPERERTKHVHRLHPYLGKFVPQLVEIFLRKFAPKVVCDPFCGSGTTLVEANVLGIEAIGCDISEFNCLLSKVKTAKYNISALEKEIKDVVNKVNLTMSDGLFSSGEPFETNNEYLQQWYAPKARRQLLCFRSLIPNYRYQDLLKIILSRAARSARLTTHFDLDFPKAPQRGPYYCYKHDRTCKPTDDALQFLNRYAFDTLARIKEFSKLRMDSKVTIISGDARKVDFPHIDAVITSPPYVGLINYHEQHRYAYELLGLKESRNFEIGPAFKGNSQKAQDMYIKEIAHVFKNIYPKLPKDGVVVIVVNDKFRLYENLASQIGYHLETILTRHVNRRTGRRSTDFFEEVLIWKKR